MSAGHGDAEHPLIQPGLGGEQVLQIPCRPKNGERNSGISERGFERGLVVEDARAGVSAIRTQGCVHDMCFTRARGLR